MTINPTHPIRHAPRPGGHPAAPVPVLAPILPEQIEDALCVLNSAAARLQRQGIEQWPATFDEGGDRVEKLVHEAGQGNLFVARLGSHPIGTITITAWQDPDFADAWPADTRALYFYRAAVSDAGQRLGMGLGAWMIEHAATIADIRGYQALRLDCCRTNERLRAYYIGLGFKPMGVRVAINPKTKRERKSGALFERRVRP